MRVQCSGNAGGRRRAPAAPPLGSSPGLRIVVPGSSQWWWGQHGRGAVLFGSFASALGVAAFAWGTRTGLAVLGFAFLAHVFSTADAIRQSAFPGFGRLVPWLSAAGGLGVGVYAPALLAASLVATPAGHAGPDGDGYLVNCLAYRGRPPGGGDWVWLRPSRGSERLGRVIAGPEQEVEWSDSQLRVDGVPLPFGWPFRSARPPIALGYTVPEGHVLVKLGRSERRAGTQGGLAIVPTEQVVGRAWAQAYPVGSRRLLP